MTPPLADAELDALLERIFHTYHYDFRCYSLASLHRGVKNAMSHFNVATVDELTCRVIDHPGRFTELLRYLTIQVSDMFRDPLYFRTVRDAVVPYLKTYAALKIWIAGCATGEEAYSLAIVLREEGLLDRSMIYATDISAESLAIAQHGVYATERFAKFSEAYLAAGGRAMLSDYCTAAYNGVMLDRSLRQAIVFSDHSLATDHAFAEIQFASCRNVLIYFEKPLQERALGVLSDALCRKGFLGLGIKENLRFTRFAPQYIELAPDARVYQKL